MPEANHQIYLSEPTEAAIIVHSFTAKLNVTTYPYPECTYGLIINQIGSMNHIVRNSRTCCKQAHCYLRK